MTDDHVIDIGKYLGLRNGVPPPRAFSVWGGGGDRSRLALPVWRAINLLGGSWGGIVSLSRSDPAAAPEFFFVLDLMETPARLVSCPESLRLLQGKRVPSLTSEEGGGLAVLLGEDDQRSWLLTVLGRPSRRLPVGRDRETLLFLAGECSGLLFLRKLATLPPSSS